MSCDRRCVPRSWRLRLVVFLVRMWRLIRAAALDTCRCARTLKRFAAPLLVFILGMTAPCFYMTPGGMLRALWSPAITCCPVYRLLWPAAQAACRRFRAAASASSVSTSARSAGYRLPASVPSSSAPAPSPSAGLPASETARPRRRLEIASHALEQPHAELLVRHLAAAEAQRDLGLVAFFEEADQVAQLDLVVALVGAGTELDFLDLDLLLLELGLVPLLLLSRYLNLP